MGSMDDYEDSPQPRKRQRLSPSAQMIPAPCIRAKSLIAVLESDPRPTVIFRKCVREDIDEYTEFENDAFRDVFEDPCQRSQFIKHASQFISRSITQSESQWERGCTRSDILGRHCTIQSIPDSFYMVSWDEYLHRIYRAATPPPSQRLPNKIETLKVSEPGLSSGDQTPSELSPLTTEPWERAADSLGWTKYKDTKLSEHQMRIASYPWHETPLGPVESWTASHRCAVAAIALNPNPRCLYWGRNLIALYNEGCIPIFGQKHPAFLGCHPGDIWPEAWENAKGFVERAMFEGKASRLDNMQLFINRRGFLEECFFDGVFLPLPEPEGGDCGVVNQFTEITDSSLAKRQQSLINNINEKTQDVANVHGFWAATMLAIESAENDVAYALLYTQEDGSGSPVLSRRSSVVSETATSAQYTLKHQVGHQMSPFYPGSRFDLASSAQDDDHLVRAMHLASTGRKVEILTQGEGSLPAHLHVAVEGRGHGDVVNAVAILPITSLAAENPSAFMVIGLNLRRPVDDRAKTFAQVLRDCLVKGSTLANLSRRGRRNQKKMDELHQSLLSRLHESHIESRKLSERFQRISDSAPIGMFIAQPDSAKQKLYVNDQWVKTLGITREELDEGQSWLDRIHEEDRDRVAAFIKHLRENPRACVLEYRTKNMFEIIEEGTGRPIQIPQHLMVTSVPEYDEQGGLSCITGWIQNVSQDRFTQRLLQARLEEVTASKQSAENFIDMVSHEMRNPLSAILQCADGIASITDNAGPAPADNQISRPTAQSIVEAAETIILCAQHQKRIVDDILTLSKLDSKLLIISPDMTDPVALLTKVSKMFEAQLANAGIKTAVVVEPSFRSSGIEYVTLDSSRVLQIIINLLTNAIKFTAAATHKNITLMLSASTTSPAAIEDGIDYVPRRSGGQKLCLDDFGDGEDVYLTFKVRDTGKGLSPEEKCTLFQRFSQATAKTYKKYGGSGLGLFISRELTELQGGQIGVSSEAGGGSTFAFYVLARRCSPPTSAAPSMPASPMLCPSRVSPLRQALLSPPELAPTTTPRSAPHDHHSTQSSPLSILIVEDNHINLAVMAKQITIAGHTVHTATNGLEALAFISRTTFNPASGPNAIALSVILMDLEMPILDGKGCVRRIRAMQRAGELREHIPVIAVTANARAEHIAAAKEAGMDDVVTKPCRIKEVLASAEELVQTMKNGKDELRGEREDSGLVL